MRIRLRMHAAAPQWRSRIAPRRRRRHGWTSILMTTVNGHSPSHGRLVLPPVCLPLTPWPHPRCMCSSATSTRLADRY